jgi:hypothetical protein
MKTLGVLESKWDPIRKNLVRRLLEEQDKVLRSYFAQKSGVRSQRGSGNHGKGREYVLGHVCVKKECTGSSSEECSADVEMEISFAKAATPSGSSPRPLS